MGLTSLPTELLLEILSQVRRRDLKKLCEVSKSFYNFTVPILYKSVGLEVEDEYSMEEVNMELLLRPRRQPQDVLHFTEDFFIAASFHSLIEQRCWNYWGSKPLERTTNNSDDDGDYIENMAKKLIYVLERFKDGQLRSFSWELGVCIPARLLGDSGYLTIRQNRVEAIRLITDSSCGHEFHDPPALKSFQALKNLSWVGLCMQDEFEALRDTLIQRSDQLQELELDLIDWYGAVNNAWDDEVSENFFGEHVLGISYDDTRCILPSLRVLSLSEIAFHPFEKEIACAFGSSRLRSLKLRFCYGWEGFLAHMKDLNSQIGIKSLEVQYSSKYECDAYEYPTYDGEHPLLAFIRAFDGLEELFISTGTPSNTLDIWKAALSHKSTLKRLVHHQREFNADVEFADFLGDGNSKNFSLDSGDPRMLMQDPLRYPLASFNLECFGICCEPKYLV
ncbi:hypothetical protein FQN49_004880 [Arthroderma sp. PD_2]|nr:hypothetical protein FQN49_004880 [Arthroderma sp. PD_2]